LPVSGDTLGSTRDRIRGNFQETDAVLAINHVAFNTVGKGKHKFLQMPEVTASGAGVPVTLANEAGFYADVGTNPAEANLFFRGENNGYEYQLTRAIAASTALFSTNTVYPGAQAYEKGGWTFLAGNLMFQYGSVLPGQSTSQTGTTKFPVQFTAAPYIVLATPVSRSAGVGTQTRVVSIKDGSILNNQFSWTWDNGTSNYVGFNWIAIGK
jgi:hypothetical protein